MYDGLDMTKVMFGAAAVHVPAWLYVQDGGIIVGASKDPRVAFGGTKTHQLMLGEIILRPHWVVESNSFRGHGVTSLLTSSHQDFLMADDLTVLADPLGKIRDTIRKIAGG